MWTPIFTYFLTTFISLGAREVVSLSASGSIEAEVCNLEYFRASCANDEVIVIESAQYGRYQVDRCISESFGYLGCMNDVMLEAESYCSGRRDCEIRVDDASFKRVVPCHKDLKNHLWISYRCYKVITPKNNCYPNGVPEVLIDLTKLTQPTTVSGMKNLEVKSIIHPQRYPDGKIQPSRITSSTTSLPRDVIPSDPAGRPPTHARHMTQSQSTSFLLSSYVTEQTGCGTTDSPWVLTVGEGQRINLTLYDFSTEALMSPLSGGDGYYKEYDKDLSGAGNRGHNGGVQGGKGNWSTDTSQRTCRVLTTIRESPTVRSNTICSNHGRVVNVATSLTNRIELRFLVTPKHLRPKGEEENGKSRGGKPSQTSQYQLQSHFLFQIKVIGCATPPVLEGMRVKRVGDHVTIDCGSDVGESWQMTCADNFWNGYYRNCSQDSLSLHSKLEGIMPYATSIIIVGIIAVLMVCLILTAGIFCIKWRLRQDVNRTRFQPKSPVSRDTDYGYSANQQQLDDRKYPLLPGSSQIASYYPVLASGADNLNEYATMRLLQQNEQLMRGGLIRGGVGQPPPPEQNHGPADMVMIAENYRFQPTKTGVMTSFLAGNSSQYNFRNDHIYECPDLVKQEVARLVANTPVTLQSHDVTSGVPVECSVKNGGDLSSRNFSL